MHFNLKKYYIKLARKLFKYLRKSSNNCVEIGLIYRQKTKINQVIQDSFLVSHPNLSMKI